MIIINNEKIIYNFNDETNLKLNFSPDSTDIEIIWAYEKLEELSILQLLIKHIRNNFFYKKMVLNLPLLPFLENDEALDNNSVFCLKYFCEILNSIKFDVVIVNEPVCKVAKALLNNIVVQDIYQQGIDNLIKFDPNLKVFDLDSKEKELKIETETSPDILICRHNYKINDINFKEFLTKAMINTNIKNIYFWLPNCNDSITKTYWISSEKIKKVFTLGYSIKEENYKIQKIIGENNK